MKLKAGLFLVLGALLVASSATSGPKGNAQGQNQKCVTACKTDCRKSFDTCRKSAASASGLEACHQSLETCNANCLNKACQ